MDECLTCVVDDDGPRTHSPSSDSIFNENGDGHNDGLASALMELESAAADGPLTAEEARVILEPHVDAYLRDYMADRGTTVPAFFDWDAVHEMYDRYHAGEDIVALYASPSLSPEARQLAYDVLESAGSSYATVRQEMEWRQEDADDLLYGSEREAMIAVAGLGNFSATYWENEIQRWDAVLANSKAGCGRRMVATDIAGGIWGAVHTRTWQGALAAGLGGSIISGFLCHLGI